MCIIIRVIGTPYLMAPYDTSLTSPRSPVNIPRLLSVRLYKNWLFNLAIFFGTSVDKRFLFFMKAFAARTVTQLSMARWKCARTIEDSLLVTFFLFMMIPSFQNIFQFSLKQFWIIIFCHSTKSKTPSNGTLLTENVCTQKRYETRIRLTCWKRCVDIWLS